MVHHQLHATRHISSRRGALWVLVCFLLFISSDYGAAAAAPRRRNRASRRQKEGFRGAVAADEGRCSVVGRDVMHKRRGNAVDAAVATALCQGVLNPMASGIGGGGFLLLHSAQTGLTMAYDMREVAPAAAFEDMYVNHSDTQTVGPLSMAVPGEVAGLHLVWQEHGSLPWEALFQPAINFADVGFVVKPYLEQAINLSSDAILADAGLREVFAPNGTLLKAGDVCFNKALARTLRAIATGGPNVYYKGAIGQNLVKDVRTAGGILTMDDLNAYKVKVRKPLVQDVQGLTVIGMPPPSSGAATMFLALNILAAYPNPLHGVSGLLGQHRMVEAFKHAFAVRMNLGDPDFVNITAVLSDMLNVTFAAELQKLITDNGTHPPTDYGGRWNKLTQLMDHGTSHFNIVDEKRNIVSMTSTINYSFGAKILSRSTGIILNNEMGDFSNPTDTPSENENLIKPFKRPLSSMSPTIVLKDGLFFGALGASGGVRIITTATQVFLNHYWKGYDPLHSVAYPRLHHQLMPNILEYEDWTTAIGDHIEEPKTLVEFLQSKGHNVSAAPGAVSQLIVQDWTGQESTTRAPFIGKLVAVSDRRKDGFPAAF